MQGVKKGSKGLCDLLKRTSPSEIGEAGKTAIITYPFASTLQSQRGQECIGHKISGCARTEAKVAKDIPMSGARCDDNGIGPLAQRLTEPKCFFYG